MIDSAVVFIVLALGATLVSFLKDRRKTAQGLQKGWKMFLNVLPSFVNILMLVSVALYVVPSSLIVRTLGPGSGWVGMAMAALVGSIALIPGFISYPIAAVLVQQGASYATVAIFMTTLMLVGVMTLPLESSYFGRRVAVLRNALNFLAAIVIGLFVGWVL
ncbi:MAG: permease [Candidatus Methylomirabilota bacterium]